MEKNDTVKILGTDYKVITDTDRCKQKNADGLCCVYEKEIYIRELEDMLSDSDSRDAKMKRFREVLRHEIIHAFFHECGLEEYSDNEFIVDWIAMNFPKMSTSFDEIGAND